MCCHQKHMGALHILLSQTGFPRSSLSFGICRISLLCVLLCLYLVFWRKKIKIISKRSIFLSPPPLGNFFFNSLILSGCTNFSLFKQVLSYRCFWELQVNVETIAFVMQRRDDGSPSRQIIYDLFAISHLLQYT